MPTVRTVWLLLNLILDGELCLRDGNNAAFVFTSSPSIAVAGKHGKHHAMRAHKPQAVSHWLNPHSLWTMLAFGYIDSLAYNSARLVNYQDMTRSI